MNRPGTCGRAAAFSVFVMLCSGCATAPSRQVDEAQATDAASKHPQQKESISIVQKTFDSPDEAMKALMKACEAKDRETLRQIFGPRVTELKSGDDVQDAHDFENFARRLAAACRPVPENDRTVILHVGVEDHPFPVPLVKNGSKWSFDTEAGVEEVLNRRIGENEIKAEAVCRGYVVAQKEYAMADQDADDVIEYAQRLASTPGKHDGLFWETNEGEPPSPLGGLVADARAEGYTMKRDNASAGPKPYHGYLYKILTRQGSHAPGGKFDYVINGHMVAGFALVAYPADWGSSGIMTFVVNSNGKVLEKNLGADSARIAATIDVYDPDASWKLSD